MRKLLIALFIASAVIGCRASRDTAAPTDTAATRPATRPAARAMEHRLDIFGLDTLHDGVFRRTRVRDDDDVAGITLHNPAVDYPFTGTWTSNTRETAFPFTELLPSWNAIVPDNTGIRFAVRVRDAENKTWSPWLHIGYWGRVTAKTRVIQFDGGKVAVDVLELTRPADAYEIRATLEDFHVDAPGESPVLRRLAVAYSRPSDHDFITPPTSALEPVSIDVPFRPQGDNPKSISGSTCSPTSVNMVMAWAGTDRPMLESAMRIWDDEFALFGNWNRAVQFPGSLGHDAWLQRFGTMNEVRDTLKAGQPIVASIRFKRGTFPSNLQQDTAGHLIVLRGYDANGDIVVNDPCSRARGRGVVYKADELARAWLVNTGGVGYVIGKKPS